MMEVVVGIKLKIYPHNLNYKSLVDQVILFLIFKIT